LRQFGIFRHIDQKERRVPVRQKDLTHCKPGAKRAQGGALGKKRKTEQQRDGAGQNVMAFHCHCALLSGAKYGCGFGDGDEFF
jgi:hypothetical protein